MTNPSLKRIDFAGRRNRTLSVYLRHEYQPLLVPDPNYIHRDSMSQLQICFWVAR